ncbi:AAA ATPase-like protein [Pseudoduganella lurida]|uniref:AAA ATPase-like protein n=1 Tax=Pseudoduganella lurida TaxID=1036180 RepID=A0A562REU2_9BURK|nr:winged helix-turn-helix domain-containing protein [Pseudoduganella lurida]TWI67538.1 AAA ATPase-like protein [Pseudoduganella lurida]
MRLGGFRFGEYQVEVSGNALNHFGARTPLEPRAMDVLRYLCRHPGAVIPAEELLQACWGTAELGDNPVHKAIAQLRRALGDSSTEPRYIETVRKRGYRAIAEVVEAPELPGTWTGGSPFRGLEPFEESHATIFFGRLDATARLRDIVLRQAAAGCALALVLGPSGSGKTSLVRAGLLPRLAPDEERPDAIVAADCTLHMDCADLAGGSLHGALAAVLVDAELDGRLVFDGSSAEVLATRLRDAPAAVAAQLAAATDRVRIVLFVDRLEAVFRAPDASDADRAAFVTLLDRLARCGTLLVLLACRNDFYPELIALPELTGLKAAGGHFDLAPPTGADIAQMVRQPAQAAQLTFERDATTGSRLDDVLCDAARASPDALPLLQYCLNELYRQRGADGALRFDVFRQLGGIEGALGVRAEQIVAALPAAQQAALPQVLSLLVAVSDDQNLVTARRPAWAALATEPERDLVRALVEARLFVSELTAEVPGFGVAHEALLRRWPRVADWIERHRHALQVRTRLNAQAERWAGAGRPRDLLLPAGSQVNGARALLAVREVSLSPVAREFVQRSVSRMKLGQRIVAGVVGSFVMLAMLTGFMGVRAQTARHEAERHRLEAEGLLGFMLGDFAEKLRPLGRLDLLDSVSGKALSYLATAGERDDLTTRMQRVATLQMIAEVGMARGNQDKALEALQAGRAMLAPYAAQATSAEALERLGDNAAYLGRLYFDRKAFVQAGQHFEEAIGFATRLASLVNDADHWNQLASAHNSLGGVAKASEQYGKAAQHFELAVALNRRAVAASPGNRDYLGGLANSLSWLGDTMSLSGRAADAARYFAEEGTLLEGLRLAAPNELRWTSRLAYALWHRGNAQLENGERAAAADSYARARALVDDLTQRDPSNQRWQVDLMRLKLREIRTQTQPDAAATLAEIQALYRQSTEMSKAQPDNPELRRLASQILERADSARSQLQSR